jgi:hypothetical protein
VHFLIEQTAGQNPSFCYTPKAPFWHKNAIEIKSVNAEMART